MTAAPFQVTESEAAAIRSLEVVVWWCRLVIREGRGGVLPLGENPDLNADEQAYVDAHVNAVGADLGREHVTLWQQWQKAGLPPLEPSLRFRA